MAIPVFVDYEKLNGEARMDAHPALKQTDAEIAAGVTPVNYAFPPLDIRRYGAIGDGIANDRDALQAAIDVAKVRGGAVVLPQPLQTYRIESALDLTAPVGFVICGFTIRGDANVNTAVTGFPATLTFVHTGHAFDCTGTLGVIFENFSVSTDTSTFPKTCFLLARNSDAKSQVVRFRHVHVRGSFSEAIVYNYGSEDDQYDGCFFFNLASTANARVAYFTAYNIRSLTSTFTTIATLHQSTIDHKIFGGEWANLTDEAAGDVIYCESIFGLKVFGPWMLCGSEAVGANPRSLFYFDSTNGPCANILILGVTGEHSTSFQQYGVAMSGAAATHSYFVIEASTFPNTGQMIYADTGIICDDFHVKAISNQTVGGGIVFQKLQNSHIDELAAPVTIGEDINNVLNVDTTTFAITLRSGGTSVSGSGSPTWTPGLAAVTKAGPGVVSNKTVHYHGRQVTVTAVFTGYTTFTTAAGAAITGLPAAAFVGSGVVMVLDLTNDALLGVGNVNGTSIIMPAITAGANQVAITATYFIS
jgi:hypothetical protein